MPKLQNSNLYSLIACSFMQQNTDSPGGASQTKPSNLEKVVGLLISVSIHILHQFTELSAYC